MVTVRSKTSLIPLTILLVLIFSFGCAVNAQSVNSSSRLRPIQQNGKWGYIDNTGVQFIRKSGLDAELIDKSGKTILAVEDIETNGFSDLN